MELEFDKEMDAILRRAQHKGAAPASAHLDADVMAAFAENALPEKARSRYTLHLADCDRCRKQLSGIIALSAEHPKTAAAAPLTTPAVEAAVPWYQSIFRTPNLAIAMGGLVLVFSGVLGFLMLQNNRDAQNAVVTQVTEQESQPAAPAFIENSGQANANAAVSAVPEQLATANTTVSTADQAANAATRATTGGDTRGPAAEAPASDADVNITARQLSELPKAAAVAPPPPAPAAGATTDSVVAKEAKNDAETRQAERSDESLALKRREADASRARDLPPAAAKPGPGRSGPVQMQQNQNARNAVQMTVTRSAGGRKFTNREGAWYDTDYKGQATTNVRRGSDDFKKLDSGLRSIANQIDGVVVVVWKSKAYRIQ